MQKFKIPLILLLILVIIIVFYFWNSYSKIEKQPEPVETVSEKINKEISPVNGLSIQEKLKQNKAELKKENTLFVDRIQAFNPDPSVDAELIKINFEHCLELLNSDEESVVSYKIIDNQSDNQIKYKQDLNTYCDDINNKHPEYLLTNQDNIKLLRDSINTDNETGKILSNFYNDKNIKLNARELASKVQYLKNTNPNLLFNLKSYFKYYFGEKLLDEVSEITKSNERMYLYTVKKGALDYYACKAGADCGMYSNIMSEYCTFRNLCGADFNDMLENKISEGVRLDILLVYKYLKKSFD